MALYRRAPLDYEDRMARETETVFAEAAPPQWAGAVPLYHQIFLALRDDILAGRLPFGASVPTEHELAAQHGVSRITARRALHELAANKLVERRRRTGTRVVYRASTVPIEANVEQAIESLLAFGRNTPVKVLDLSKEPAPTDIAAILDRPVGTLVYKARRIRHTDKEPLGVVTSWLPADLGVKITKRTLTSTPILKHLHDADITIVGGRQTVSAVHASVETAALLGIEPRDALLRIERVVLDDADKPVLFTIADYRADRYRISLDLHGGPRPAVG
nr:GntR family transcriptional regulator [Novosphingobium panipatense]